MQDEPREVTTFCPRCGRPLVWSWYEGLAVGGPWY